MPDRRNPPTPGGPPVLGQGLAFARSPFDSIEEWASLAPVVHLSFPGRSQYLVTDPDLIAAVLVERQDRFTIGRDQRATFAGIEDDAVTATTGDRWRRLRTGLHPAFTKDAIEAYAPRIADRVRTDVQSWGDGESVDLLGTMRRLTLHVLGDTLLGVDTSGDEDRILAAADALVDRADPRRPGQLLPDWVPTPTERRFRRRVTALDEYVADIIQEKHPGRDDVVSVLLAAHEEGTLTMDEVRDNTTALLLAGHDSTALTLTYAVRELSRHPSILDAVRFEVQTNRGGEMPTAETIESLDLTRRVVDETLRLYPPTWTVNREAIEPVTLGDYRLPGGAQLTMPQWVLHRDPEYWHSPETWDPDRWTREEDRPEYAYFPFSGGPRHCIGMRFARLELVTALAELVSHVTFDVEPIDALSFTPSLSLRPETTITATVRHRT